MLLLARVAMAPEREHLRDEMPNLAQPLAHAPADGLANDAVLLVLVLQASWGEIAVPTGAPDTLGQSLAAPGIEPSRLAAGHALAATFCQDAGWMDRNAERARACIEETLPMARQLQRPNTEASLLGLEGHLLTVVDRNPHQGLRQGERATQIMAAAETQWRPRFGELEANDLLDRKRMRRFARTLLGPQAAQAAWHVGATRTLGDAVRALMQAPRDAGG